MKKTLLLIIILCVILLSCITNNAGTVTDFSEAPLAGMVYDSEHNPCNGAIIIVDGKIGPTTDINGRFVINSLSKGKHSITVEKEKHEKLTVSFDFLNRSQILYLNLVSINYIIKNIQRAIEERRLGKAYRLIGRAEKIDTRDPTVMYLKSIYYIKLKDFYSAQKILQDMLSLGYKEPVVYLSLADINQFNFKRKKEAILYLKEYLKLKINPKIEERLSKLINNNVK